MGLFDDRKKLENGKKQVPVWFMRQAGRYHSHYQNIKKNSNFMQMCKTPELACEITLGPVEEFSFDAAILFSDLLFPLELIGMGLSYNSGPPTLEVKLEHLNDLKKLKASQDPATFYGFQKKSLELLKQKLSSEVSLLGFTGAPFTLYTYAVEGAHKGSLVSSKKGLYDGRFEGLCEFLVPSIIEQLSLQAEGGADGLCLFDTAAGELTLKDYTRFILPKIRSVTKELKKRYPEKKIIYYSKMTHLDYLEEIQDDNIDVLGIDWRCNLVSALKRFSKDYYIQGNIDPVWLHLPWQNLETNLAQFWAELQSHDLNLDRWIAGLGHGVIIETPEQNVKKTVEYIHRNFIY